MSCCTRSRAVRADADQGFTLVELLVVLGIIALLAALVAPRVVHHLGDARSETARMQLRNVASALELYYLDAGSYPATLRSLVDKPTEASRWRGPYLRNADSLADPWGRPYLYEIKDEGSRFELHSLGKDGREGGEGEDEDLKAN
jgi:general secretion pathway protein G